MKKVTLLSVTLLLILIQFSCTERVLHSSPPDYDVAIMGGGASGVSAGLQASRLGAKTVILESTEWLGGMLTSAGVSAVDGNHNMPSGIWGEFRDSLIQRYGGLDKLASGWVSNTLFDPKVGQEVFTNMTRRQNELTVLRNVNVSGVERSSEFWLIRSEGREDITAKIIVDATELGDALKWVDLPYDVGMQDGADEPINEDNLNDIVQDLTYVAILEAYEGDDHLLERPANYNASEFDCACKTDQNKIEAVDCLTMLNYGKFPNGKYMINWPNCGNDIYLNIIELGEAAREVALEEAKQMTLRFVYYIQNDLGFRDLGISKSTFPTEDNLPLIAYHRESRRIKGKIRLLSKHLEKPYDYHLYRTGVAVGDYPIDHHHKKNPLAPKIDFIGLKVPSYNIPLGTLLPSDQENLIVAEKSISVSNVVNGTTRLQPVVLGIGQAAGALAGVAIGEGVNVSDVSVRSVQNALLEHDAYIMPFMDITADDSDFIAVQKSGALGILKGAGMPYKWANRTFVYPDSLMKYSDLRSVANELRKEMDTSEETYVTAESIFQFLTFFNSPMNDFENFKKEIIGMDIKEKYITRRQVARIIEEFTDLFDWPIDYEGNFIFNKD